VIDVTADDGRADYLRGPARPTRSTWQRGLDAYRRALDIARRRLQRADEEPEEEM
jgi:hypothetical protein